MEEKNEEILKKQDKELCLENFTKYILKTSSETNIKSLNSKNKEDLISKGELSSKYLRPIAYKIFLDLLPLDKIKEQHPFIEFRSHGCANIYPWNGSFQNNSLWLLTSDPKK